jgi:4-amino-4-deoxy-L-arabinose transferase-like glycosyltransferase
MQLSMKVRFTQLLSLSWLCLLGISILLSAWNSYQRTLKVSEYPAGCDAFGYLIMAKEVRRAARNLELPRFLLEAPQSRLLIDSMKSQNVPVSNWDEMVAPLGAHYFPSADHIGIQYPPGTGLALALFPEKRAVHSLNRIVFLSFVTFGVVALAFAGIKRAWISVGFIALTCYLGFEILGKIGNMSFSINAVLAPLLLAFVFLFISFRFTFEKRRAAWWAALSGGLLLGLATLIRMPVILLVPGCLVLVWPRDWIRQIKGPVTAFGLGVFCAGIAPLLAHQHRVAGSWYLPTYASGDTSPPSLDINLLKSNLAFYFASGPGSRHSWELYILFAGLAGLVLLKPSLNSAEPGLGWRRIIVSAFILWAVPTAFFMTHTPSIAYYPIPTLFGTALLVTFAAVTIERSSTDAGAYAGVAKLRGLRWFFLALALLPGLVTVERVWASPSVAYNVTEETYPDLIVPVELADKRAWVWSEGLSGTLWYYAEKPAYKFGWTNARTRSLAYRLAFERGEPQYIIRDRTDIEPLLAEVFQLGGVLETRGVIDGYPYYLIRWPEAGPSRP